VCLGFFPVMLAREALEHLSLVGCTVKLGLAANRYEEVVVVAAHRLIPQDPDEVIRCMSQKNGCSEFDISMDICNEIIRH
jgi:hypothetical protein